jgi:L-fuculose-phosphate aldolase
MIMTGSDAFVASTVRRAVLDCIANQSSAAAVTGEPAALFASPAAQAIKEEILSAGKKLWLREYVDGNGGNISFRISDDLVICTPTLCSKGDMRAEDLSLVDLNNCRVCGDRAQTSEILLHLEIYKAVPEAKAVIHCHPPYATAHAIAGIVPRGNLIPEQEVFVGPVALAPYDTPGTLEFARTVVPFVQDHNTVLLTNHGVVCWADTVTHAEWYVEVVENYCKTLTIASQLGVPINEIPADKIPGLLAMKQRLGLPDPRLKQKKAAPAVTTAAVPVTTTAAPPLAAKDVDELIVSITSQVLAYLRK